VRNIFSIFLDFLPGLRHTQNHRLMRGASTRPTESGCIRLTRRTEGIRLKRQAFVSCSGMKGWRPSADKEPRPDRALCEAGVFLPTSDRSPLSFPRGASSGSLPGDAPRTPGFLISSNQARGRAVGRKGRPSLLRSKRRQPFACFLRGRTYDEDKKDIQQAAAGSQRPVSRPARMIFSAICLITR
jgi:hypothetical protein